MDPTRRPWLEKLSKACERVLASDQGDRTDPRYGALLADIAALHARLEAELQSTDR